MFRKRLVELRSLSNLTQEDLAKKLGVSRVCVTKWETGKSTPDIHRFFQIARIFGVTMEDLLGEKTEYKFLHHHKGTDVYGMTHMSEKGQVVIPVRARKSLDIKPGAYFLACRTENDELLLIPQAQMIDYLNNTQPRDTQAPASEE